MKKVRPDSTIDTEQCVLVEHRCEVETFRFGEYTENIELFSCFQYFSIFFLAVKPANKDRVLENVIQTVTNQQTEHNT